MGNLRNQRNQCGRRVFARIFRIESVDVRENHQQVRIGQVSHFAREGVVVTDPDFIDRDGVVFIDDGHDAETDECRECMAGVQKSAAISEILVGEQNLRHVNIETFKRFFISPHEPALPHGCGRLLDREALGILLQLQLSDAGDNGTGRDHQDFPTRCSEYRDVISQSLNLLGA